MSITGAGSGGQSLITENLLGSQGINTQELIAALLQSYEQPEIDLENQQGQLQAQVNDYQAINSAVQALEKAAAGLSTITATSNWANQATSSNPDVATATASPTTPTGSVSFTVSQLATNDTLISSGSVANTSQVVTSATTFLLSQASGLGFSELVAGSGLGVGSHSIQVTQASQGAQATGTSAVASSTTISTSNDTLDVTVNGTAETYTLASGTYTPSQLAQAVAQASGGALQATVNAAGDLVVTTTAQGAAASIQVTGGTALGALGLSTMGAANQGVNAHVVVDGTENVIGNSTTGPITAGATFSLTSGSGGTIQATVGSGGSINAGSTTATNVSTGNQTLAEIVANINAANAGVSASAIDTSSGYVLELSSSASGSANDLTIDTGAFSSSSLGNLSTAQAGQNAIIDIGGNSADQVTSSSNQVSGLLPGLTVDLQSTSASLVTITTAPDANAVATSVQGLVNAANSVLSAIAKYASYDPQTNVAGPLFGSPQLEQLQQGILSTFADATGTSTLDTQAIGITLNKDGTLSFDQSTFESAMQANPQQVEALFAQGGTFTPSASAYQGDVSLVYASDQTQQGSYAVDVTQSASQATDLGAVLSSGAVSASETLSISMNGLSAKYTTTAGESLSAIADALNQAFGAAGMPLSAQVVDGGDQLELISAHYGSDTSFSVSTTNTATGTTGLAGSSGSATFTGTNVEGTIGGQSATGTGRILATSPESPGTAGLTLEVTASGITSSTNIGSFVYQPGLAQQLQSFSDQMSNPSNGSITEVINGLNQQSTGLNSQIDFWQQIVAQEKQILTQEFDNLQVQLISLQNQGNALTAALNGLPAA
jgi:flagellar hook-associated protein 2